MPPNPRDYFTNLNAPMPLHEKLARIAANNWTKFRTLSACCGNHGDPGC